VTAAGGPAVNPDGVQLLRQTIAHEAQHVVMEMRGSGFDAYLPDKVPGIAARWLFDVARKMCDEHRAEWNAVQVTSREPPTICDVLDVLCHMGQELAAAHNRYQLSSHLPVDVGRLRDDVYTACAPFWTAIAYWGAQSRRGDDIGDVPEEIAQLKMWQLYVGGTWEPMAKALGQLPVADLTTSPNVLHRAARTLAAAVDKSLNHIGFQHVDGPQGQAFYIRKHVFQSARE
jgi:hypothetical protein